MKESNLRTPSALAVGVCQIVKPFLKENSGIMGAISLAKLALKEK